MYGGGDDDRHAQRDRADQHGQRRVVLIDDLPPQRVWSQPIDDHERHDQHGDAEDREHDCGDEVAEECGFHRSLPSEVTGRAVVERPVRAGVVANRTRDVAHDGRPRGEPAAHVGHRRAADDEHTEHEKQGGFHQCGFLFVIVVIRVARRAVVAFLHPPALERGVPDDAEEHGNAQQEQAQDVGQDGGHVSPHANGEGHRWAVHRSFRLHAQVVLAGRHRPQQLRRRRAALRPECAVVVAVVVADLVLDVERVARLKVDERQVEAEPGVVDGGAEPDFDGRGITESERCGHERRLGDRGREGVLIGEDALAIGRDEPDHGHQHQHAGKRQEGQDHRPHASRARIGLVGEDADRLWRGVGQRERLPDRVGRRVTTDGPRAFLGGPLARQHERRRDEVVGLDLLAHAHAPRKLAEHEVGAGDGMLEGLEDVRSVRHRRTRPAAFFRRSLAHRGHVVPVAVVVRQVAETLVGIEQDVLVPRIPHALHLDRALLEADDVVGLAVPRAAGAERDQRRDRLSRRGLLQDGDVAVARIDDRAAARAGHGACVRERTQFDGGAAVAAVEPLHRARAIGGLEHAEVAQLQFLERDESPDEQDRGAVAVVDGAERGVVAAEVGKQHVLLAPVLERQFTLDALVPGRRQGRHLQPPVVPGVLEAELHRAGIRQRARGLNETRHGELELSVRQPPARAVGIHEVPLVPPSVFVLVDDAADDGEAAAIERALGADLDRRTVGRQVRDLANRLEIDVVPDDDRATGLARGLDGARPAKTEGRAAVRAATGRASHSVPAPAVPFRTPDSRLPTPDSRSCPYVRSMRRTRVSVAPSISAIRRAASKSSRARQQNTLTQIDPNSGNVWQARCDSARITNPVNPPGDGNVCQTAGATGVRRRSATSLSKRACRRTPSRSTSPSHPRASMIHSAPCPDDAGPAEGAGAKAAATTRSW